MLFFSPSRLYCRISLTSGADKSCSGVYAGVMLLSNDQLWEGERFLLWFSHFCGLQTLRHDILLSTRGSLVFRRDNLLAKKSCEVVKAVSSFPQWLMPLQGGLVAVSHVGAKTFQI